MAKPSSNETPLLPSVSPALSPKDQLEAWSQVDDGGRRLRALPADVLYSYIQEVGLADAVPAVQLASAEQLRTFIDLDAWHRDQPDISRVLLWLRAARGPGGKRWLRKLRGLDIELFELLLRDRLRIHDLSEGEDPPEVDGASFTTFDGYFLVELPDDPPEANALRQLVTDLYAEDPTYAQRILTAVRWEMSSELTEQAYRWRAARLADLGFPPLEEALSLYAQTDLKTPAPPTELPLEVRNLPVAGQKLPSLLQQAMAALPIDQAGRVQGGLFLLGNSALVADGVDPGGLAEARAVLERTAATLSLGLWELSAGDVTAAARILLEVAFKRIFQVGFTQTLKLQWAAERAPWAAPMRLPGTDALLLDSPEREVFAAVARKRPLFPGALDGAGAPDRPFRTPLDIAAVRVSIEQSIPLAKVVVAAGVVPEEVAKGYQSHLGLHPLASLRFSDLYLTALARTLAGGAWRNGPLSPAEAAAALRVAFVPGSAEPRPETTSAGWRRLEGVAKGIEPDGYGVALGFWDLCVRRLREEIGKPTAKGQPLPATGPWRVTLE